MSFEGIHEGSAKGSVGELDRVYRALLPPKSEVEGVGTRVDAEVLVRKPVDELEDARRCVNNVADFIEDVASAVRRAMNDESTDLDQEVRDLTSKAYLDFFDLGTGAAGLGEDDLAGLADQRDAGERFVHDPVLFDFDPNDVEDVERVEQGLRAMTDAELAAWIEQVSEGNMDLFNSVMAAIPLDVVRRVGEESQLINPVLYQARPDGAAGSGASSPKDFEDYTYEDRELVDLVPPGGLDRSDISQGRIGDCYLIAAMIAIAERDPSLLTDMVIENPNNTFTVTFADGTSTVVTPDVPIGPDGGAKDKFATSTGSSEYLLVPVLEKAYAQAYGGWGETAGGQQNVAIERMVGYEGYSTNQVPTFSDVVTAHQNGEIVGLSSLNLTAPKTPIYSTPGSSGEPLHSGHAYPVIDVDPGTGNNDGTVTVINPWDGGRELVLTEAEFKDSFDGLRNSKP